MNIIKAIVDSILNAEKEAGKLNRDLTPIRQVYKGPGRLHRKPARAVLLARRKRERQNKRKGRLYAGSR